MQNLKEKLICSFKNDMMNLANLHEEMNLKNEFAKFDEELTCQFKINMRNLTNFDSSTQKSKKFAL